GRRGARAARGRRRRQSATVRPLPPRGWEPGGRRGGTGVGPSPRRGPPPAPGRPWRGGNGREAACAWPGSGPAEQHDHVVVRSQGRVHVRTPSNGGQGE